MSRPATPPPVSQQPFVVALAAWAVPGLGYGLIGQRARGITVGVAVVALFAFGLLVGGVRALEVPMVDREDVQRKRLDPHHDHRNDPLPPDLTFLNEVRNKPWAIAQFFTGPIWAAASWASAAATHVSALDAKTSGVEPHARVAEIAVLYTAVAGMLNLLAIIDSAHRAGRLLEEK